MEEQATREDCEGQCMVLNKSFLKDIKCANRPISKEKKPVQGQLQSLGRKRNVKRPSLSKLQSWCKSVSNLDLSSSMTCTPSYRLLPIKYMRQASSLHPLRAAVLNDHWVCVPSDHQSFNLRRNKRNVYEEKLQECEENCCELDVLLESTTAAIGRMEVLYNRLNSGEDISLVDDFLTVLDWRCCNGVSRECGLDVEDKVRRDPCAALPLVIEKLKSKQENLLVVQQGLIQSMKEALLNGGAKSEAGRDCSRT